jgi:hypothetical protein
MLSLGKGSYGKGYGSDGCNVTEILQEVEEIIDTNCVCTCSPEPSAQPVAPVPAPLPAEVEVDQVDPGPKPGVVVEARQTCMKSHHTYGTDTYPDLAGQCTEVTAPTKLNIRDGVFDLGWDEPSEQGFDYLMYRCDGLEPVIFGDAPPVDFPVEPGCKLIFASDNSHTYPGFNVCTDPGVAGLAPCTPRAGVVRSNESRQGGICLVSHATFNEFEARNGQGTTYPQLDGWSWPVTYKGRMNTRLMDLRGSGTGQYLTLWREGKPIKKWQGEDGPDGELTMPGDVWQFFADDSSSCGTDRETGTEKCRKGFRVWCVELCGWILIIVVCFALNLPALCELLPNTLV